MKKVLFVTTISGFLQQFEMNDVAILQEAGYEIHYASNFNNPVYKLDREELRKKGILFHHIDIEKSPVKIRQNIKAYWQLKKLLKKEQISVIHCHNPMGGVLGRLAAMHQRKVFTIYTAHGFHFYDGAPMINWLLYFTAERLLAKCTDCLITINREDYIRAGRFHLRKGGLVEKIPGVGVQTERFANKTGIREQVRQELGIGEDIFFILSVGELNQNKNHAVILKALSMIEDEHIYYGICGRGYMEEELRKTASELGLAERVFLFGFRNDIPRILSAADCFTFPSKREGLGIAALEAMATGIPLITSDCRGTREYMKHEKNGFVCADGTAAEYAEAICRMRDNPQKRKQMSQNCLKMAKKFDIAVTDRIMRRVYSTIPIEE